MVTILLLFCSLSGHIFGVGSRLSGLESLRLLLENALLLWLL